MPREKAPKEDTAPLREKLPLHLTATSYHQVPKGWKQFYLDSMRKLRPEWDLSEQWYCPCTAGDGKQHHLEWDDAAKKIVAEVKQAA